MPRWEVAVRLALQDLVMASLTAVHDNRKEVPMLRRCRLGVNVRVT
jgi:hypothetical protein